MVRNADLSRKQTVVSQVNTPAYPDLGNEAAVAADLGVVADLNQVVDFGSRADAGCAESGAIDGTVGSNLHIVSDLDPANLGYFHEPSRGILYIPEPV